jgi:hypothetical protein
VAATPIRRRVKAAAVKVPAVRKRVKALAARKKAKVLAVRRKAKVPAVRKKVKVLAVRKKVKVLAVRKKVKVLAAKALVAPTLTRRKVKAPAAVPLKTDTTECCDKARALARAFLCL